MNCAAKSIFVSASFVSTSCPQKLVTFTIVGGQLYYRDKINQSDNKTSNSQHLAGNTIIVRLRDNLALPGNRAL